MKILANRLDRPGGFCRMVLVGQTSLARRFATRPFAAIEARLAARVHLGAIDADEASELVARFYPGRSLSTDEIEILHRDSGGNPRRILRKLGPIPATRQLAVEAAEPVFKKPVAAAPAVLSPPPLIGPAKPPIRVDENMIEVGWAADDAATLDEADASPTSLSPVSTTVEAGEEAVSDHYAALQAWREWADNQARRVQVPAVAAEQAAGSTMPLDDSDDDEIDFDPDPDDLPVSRSDRPRVRPEGEQKFAPFGQLFSRMAQSHDSE